MSSPSWESIQADYEGTSKSLRALAVEHCVPFKTIQRRAQKEGWVRPVEEACQGLEDAATEVTQGVTQPSLPCVTDLEESKETLEYEGDTMSAQGAHQGPSLVKGSVSDTIPGTPLEVTQKAFAQLCRVTRDAVHDWEREGMPGVRKPTRNSVYINLLEAIPWVRDRKWLMSISDRDRKLRFEADLLEMKRDALASSLVDAAELRAEEAAWRARFLSHFMAFPEKVIPLIAAVSSEREKLSIGREEMHSALRKFAEQEQERAQGI